jgi:hypothetical protein
MATPPRILVPREHLGGVWANHVDVILGEHELTFDFARLDYRDGSPALRGVVVARVACSMEVAGPLNKLVDEHIKEYSARRARGAFGEESER